MRLINQTDVVTKLLDAGHVVGREDHRRTLIAETEDLAFEHIGVDRVEAGKWFIEYQQFGFVEHGDDKLYFLGHAFREFLDFFVPPR